MYTVWYHTPTVILIHWVVLTWLLMSIGLQHSLFETHATPYCLNVIVVECHYYVEMPLKLLWILYTNTETKILITIHEH